MEACNDSISFESITLGFAFPLAFPGFDWSCPPAATKSAFNFNNFSTSGPQTDLSALLALSNRTVSA